MANKPETPPKKRLVLISGVSGSGKSTALKALRDIGFFCVDNLPTSMLGSFADFLIKQDAPVPPIVNPKQKFALLLSSVGVDDFGDRVINSERASHCAGVLRDPQKNGHDAVTIESRDFAALIADNSASAVQVAFVNLGNE